MRLKMLVFGALLGYVLSRVGFHDFDRLQAMFTFREARLLLTFAGAVGLLTALWPLVSRGAPMTEKPFHRGIVPGALLFGAGWALTGACPPIALLQLAEGRAPALATLAGVACGVALFVRRRR